MVGAEFVFERVTRFALFSPEALTCEKALHLDLAFRARLSQHAGLEDVRVFFTLRHI